MDQRKIHFSTLLQRASKLAVTNIWRNKFLSTATTIVIAIILFTFNIILSVNFASQYIIQQTTQNFDLVVYLNNDLDTFTGLALANEIEKLENVEKVTFRSKDQAYELMRQTSPDTIKLLERNKLDNPFPPDLKVVTSSIEDHQKIIDYLKHQHSEKLHPIFNNVINQGNDQLIKANQENQKIIDHLSSNVITFINQTKEIIFWTLLIFIIGGVLIMMNAIQITIFNRQKEIEVMKMVGATYSFIRLPYILEGIIYATAAVTISVIITLIASSQSQVGPLSTITTNEYTRIFLAELLIAILLGIISSFLTVNRYLKS